MNTLIPTLIDEAGVSINTTIEPPLDIDFNHSFVYWSMDSVNHSPRCALRARCSIETESGTSVYYLTHACAAEHMYVREGLIQQPSAEFHLIFSENEEFFTVKFFDRAEDCNRSMVRIGVPFAANTNKGCTITGLKNRLRSFKQVEKLETSEAVYEAMMNDRPIIGRTQFALGDGRVTAEYPVTVMNAHHDTREFQVDTGLILLPDPALDSQLGVTSMREAFIVYNTFDYAEYILRSPVQNGAVMHFGPAVRQNCKNELFAALEI